MKKTYKAFIGIALLASFAGCDEWLVTEPQDIITDERIYSNPILMVNMLANYYGRFQQDVGLQNGQFENFANFDEGVWSGVTAGAQSRNSTVNWGFNSWGDWDYGFIRDLNVAIEKLNAGPLPQAQKDAFDAELRFIRAYQYFDMVRRHGGVPIILEQLLYDFSGDPTPLQRPRNTEAATYDFIAAEMDEVGPKLGNLSSRSRANPYTALALKSKAMLYAGSVAKYNALVTPTLVTPGGELGIPASLANSYFEKSLAASKAIIESGAYSLNEGQNQAVAFNNIFLDKSNREVIMAKDYRVDQGVAHFFSMQLSPQSRPHAVNANWGGGAISPPLQLAETYDYLDGSSGELKGVGNGTNASQASWIYYDSPADIFANKDQRLFGTLMTPGSVFAGHALDLQAGVYVFNAATGFYVKTHGVTGSNYVDGQRLTGLDGPRSGEVYVSVTGMFVRKHMDPGAAGAAITGTDNWWVLFRLGEVYMNAAEAAFELGRTAEALGYINRLRQRAGFPANSLTTLSMEKIQKERWAELAYEDHRLWDLRRWRTAHIVWDGLPNSPTAFVQALWPYRIYRPGHPNHNKWVFDKFPAQVMTAPRFFRIGNYYASIPGTGANPLLVPNPTS